MNTTVNTTCIIDDDPIYIFGTKKIMEGLNFSKEFVVYKNGKEALDNLIPKINSGKDLPDVILLDLNMPILDGWQVLDKLIELPMSYPIKIFIVSSSIAQRDLDKAKQYELVSNYLVKPFSVEKVKDLIAEIEGAL